MFKLLLSAYLIIIVPYITTSYTIEFIINNGYLADNFGMTNGLTALLVGLSVFIIEQLIATAFVKRLLWK